MTYAGAIPGSIASISRVTRRLLYQAVSGKCANGLLYTGLSPTVSLIFAISLGVSSPLLPSKNSSNAFAASSLASPNSSL